MKSQIERVEKYLLKGRKLTQLQALRLFDSLRLGSIIHQLRGRGMDIRTTMIKVRSGKWVGQYKLETK